MNTTQIRLARLSNRLRKKGSVKSADILDKIKLQFTKNKRIKALESEQGYRGGWRWRDGLFVNFSNEPINIEWNGKILQIYSGVAIRWTGGSWERANGVFTKQGRFALLDQEIFDAYKRANPNQIVSVFDREDIEGWTPVNSKFYSLVKDFEELLPYLDS